MMTASGHYEIPHPLYKNTARELRKLSSNSTWHQSKIDVAAQKEDMVRVYDLYEDMIDSVVAEKAPDVERWKDCARMINKAIEMGVDVTERLMNEEAIRMKKIEMIKNGTGIETRPRTGSEENESTAIPNMNFGVDKYGMETNPTLKELQDKLFFELRELRYTNSFFYRKMKDLIWDICRNKLRERVWRNNYESVKKELAGLRQRYISTEHTRTTIEDSLATDFCKTVEAIDSIMSDENPEFDDLLSVSMKHLHSAIGHLCYIATLRGTRNRHYALCYSADCVHVLGYSMLGGYWWLVKTLALTCELYMNDFKGELGSRNETYFGRVLELVHSKEIPAILTSAMERLFKAQQERKADEEKTSKDNEMDVDSDGSLEIINETMCKVRVDSSDCEEWSVVDKESIDED